MNILINKQYKTYNNLSRYSVYPIYYNTLDKKFEGSITGWVDNTTPYIEHTVKEFDTLDSLALYYYGNPVYYWIIADYNRIQDPFENLNAGLVLKIPTFSSISFDGVE